MKVWTWGLGRGGLDGEVGRAYGPRPEGLSNSDEWISIKQVTVNSQHTHMHTAHTHTISKVTVGLLF